MKTTQLSKLEKDDNFKKKYLPKLFWFKKAAIYPPSLVVFAALFGLLYLLNYDLLISLYAIPFALMLLLGAIWLKSVKRYILKDLFAKEDTFFVSCAKVAYEDEKHLVWSVFTTTDRRHDKYYPESVKKVLLKDNFFGSEDFLQLKSRSKEDLILLTEDFASGRNIYLKAFKKHEIRKYNAGWTEEDVFPILFIDERNILLVKRRDADI